MTEWEPATEAEVAMRDALRANDQEQYFRILARTDVLLPIAPDAPQQIGPGDAGWGTWTTDGRTHVLAFTSPGALHECLAGHPGTHRRVPFRDLATIWPNVDWWLAVNPGLPIEGYLPSWFVTQISRGDTRLPGRTLGARARMEQATNRTRAVAQVPLRSVPNQPAPTPIERQRMKAAEQPPPPPPAPASVPPAVPPRREVPPPDVAPPGAFLPTRADRPVNFDRTMGARSVPQPPPQAPVSPPADSPARGRATFPRRGLFDDEDHRSIDVPGEKELFADLPRRPGGEGDLPRRPGAGEGGLHSGGLPSRTPGSSDSPRFAGSSGPSGSSGPAGASGSSGEEADLRRYWPRRDPARSLGEVYTEHAEPVLPAAWQPPPDLPNLGGPPLPTRQPQAQPPAAFRSGEPPLPSRPAEPPLPSRPAEGSRPSESGLFGARSGEDRPFGAGGRLPGRPSTLGSGGPLPPRPAAQPVPGEGGGPLPSRSEGGSLPPRPGFGDGGSLPSRPGLGEGDPLPFRPESGSLPFRSEGGSLPPRSAPGESGSLPSRPGFGEAGAASARPGDDGDRGFGAGGAFVPRQAEDGDRGFGASRGGLPSRSARGEDALAAGGFFGAGAEAPASEQTQPIGWNGPGDARPSSLAKPAGRAPEGRPADELLPFERPVFDRPGFNRLDIEQPEVDEPAKPADFGEVASRARAAGFVDSDLDQHPFFADEPDLPRVEGQSSFFSPPMPDAEPERGDSGAFGFGDLPPRGGQPPAAAQVPAHLAEPPAVPAHLAESAGLPSRLAEPPDVPAHLAGPSGLPSRLAEPPAVPPHLAESSGLPSSLAEPPRYLGQQPEDQPSRFGEPSAGSSYFADSPIDQPPAEEPPYFAETSAPEQRESGSFFSSGSDSSFFGNGGESGASGGGSLFGSRREPAADAELDGPTEPVEYPGQVSFASGVDTLAHSGADGDGDWRDPSPELRSFFEAGATERAQLVQEEPEAPSRPGEPVYEPEIVDSAPVRLHGEIVDAEVVVPSTDSDTGSWPVGSWQANAWRQTAPQETPWEEPAPVVRPEPEPFAEWQARPASPPVVEWQPEPEPIAEWQPQPASPPVVEWQPEPEPVAEWQPQSASPPVVEWQPEPEPVAEWQPQPAADWQTPEQEPPAASPAPASSPAAAERETAPKRPDPAAIANFQSANSTEQDLFEAVQANSTDRFLSTLLLAKVLVPYWDGEGSVEPQNWRTEHMNGVPHLVVFSSQDRMEDRLGEDALGSWIKFTRLIRHWPPGDQLAFAINPESPAGAVLPGSEVIQLATWAAEMGLGVDEPEESKASSKPHEAAQPRPAFEPPASGGQLVMQKPISPEQLSYYLERNYDRVSGFVHRAGEVAHLQTPEQLYNALGLGYAGSSFKPDADESYVLRWIAYRGDLYRIPYGGSSQEAMRAMEGWVIERPPFRGNGFAPSETSDVIAEFKVDSARLPHDAELWRLRRDGRQELIARLDADGPNWRKGGAL